MCPLSVWRMAKGIMGWPGKLVAPALAQSRVIEHVLDRLALALRGQRFTPMPISGALLSRCASALPRKERVQRWCGD